MKVTSIQPQSQINLSGKLKVDIFKIHLSLTISQDGLKRLNINE